MIFSGICLITNNVPAMAKFYTKVHGVKAEGDDVHVELKTERAAIAIFSAEGMEIRRLKAFDAENLVEMVKVFRTDTSNLKVSKRFLENPYNYLIASVEGEKIVGFVLAYQLQRYDGQNDMIYIHEVSVLEEFRQKGIGKKMINEVIRICKENDISKVFLITNKSNKPAICLYESTGAKSSHNDDVVYWYNNFDSV